MLQVVVDCNDHHITPCRMQSWSWRDSIDEEAHFLTATSFVACAVRNIKGIIDGVSRGRPFL